MPERPLALSFRVASSNIGVLQTLSHDLARDKPAVAVERSEFGVDLYADTEQEMEWFIFHLRKVVPQELAVSAPEVQYREALTRPVVIDHSHESSTDERGAVASVKIAFAPRERGTGFIFSNQTELREDLVAGIERTIAQEKEGGLLHGFPLIDFRASLIEATYREAGATEEVFACATRAAFRKLARSGAMWLMEPILLATVHVLEEFVGPATADLIKRRGKILDVEDRDTAKRIRALVPASNMFGYINVLMPLAQGRARYDAVFDHYGPVPAVPRA